MPLCTLCHQNPADYYCETDIYTYFRCPNCDLVFVDPGERLPPAEEKQRYDNHENDPHDPDYREFLNQLFIPLQKKIKPNSCGLDYGSGPGPTLSIMFEEAGHRMDTFDPFYSNNRSVFNKTYDFITSTETAEHFYNPGKEFNRLWKLLKPGGTLGIMTLLRPEDGSFEDWYYIKEDTHVALYSKATFQWLADKLEAGLTFIGDRVILMEKF